MLELQSFPSAKKSGDFSIASMHEPHSVAPQVALFPGTVSS